MNVSARIAGTAMLLLLVGCSGSSSDGGSFGPKDGSPADAAARTCEEVRAGIDAFNNRQYELTIEHFQKAKPLAQSYADASDDQKADDLLEAVTYYADLPADEYRDAFESSPDFKKYQTITLGQCESGSPDNGTET